MSDTLVCQGCGAAVPVPDDYARNKMQCPECGVMCPVPPRSSAKKKPAERARAEDAALFDDDSPATRPAPSPPATTFAEESTPAGKGLATCPYCGEFVRTPGKKRGKRASCPACGADWPAAAPKPKRMAPPPAPVPPPPDEFAGSTPDEDPDSSNPYRTSDTGTRRCPGCSDLLGPEVVVCVRCGFDLRHGRKVVKEYQRLERSWNSGISPPMRVVLFLLCQGAALTAIGAAFLTLEDSLSVEIPTFVISYVVYTALTAFLLGTFDHIDLKRFKSGRVDLVRAWRIAFVPLAPAKIDVREYFGVIGGRAEYAGFWEWVVFAILFGSGVVPALIYFYCAIYKTEFFVALTNEHGNPEIKVYRGWNEEQMHEIQEALQTAMTV